MRASTTDAVPASRARRIVVFRALQLGDMLVATPALRALRAGCPDAEILLVGLPWAERWAARCATIDRYERYPGHPDLPEQPPPPEAERRHFTERLQAWEADLALQLHGDGRISNVIVASFGARCVAGFHPAGSVAPGGVFVPWPVIGPEAERLLQPLRALGIVNGEHSPGTEHDPRSDPEPFPEPDLKPELRIDDDDRRRLAKLLPTPGDAPIAVVHPGARFASRRWPAERFAAIADRLVQQGWRVAVTGTVDDRPAIAAMRRILGHARIVDLSGRTDLWILGALLERARLLVTNDTGVSHVAAAVSTPSVVVCSGADPVRWRPADTVRHRVLAHPVACRPCSHEHCPTGHECALGISVEAVWQEIVSLLGRTDVAAPERAG